MVFGHGGQRGRFEVAALEVCKVLKGQRFAEFARAVVAKVKENHRVAPADGAKAR